MPTKQEYIDLLDLKGAMKRAHLSGERASQQFTKLLGIVHGGLGVTLAAWLQRLFEGAAEHALSPLACYLAVALGFVALGLLTLGLAAIHDQLSATEHVKDVKLSIQRLVLHDQLVAARNLQGEQREIAEEKRKVEKGNFDEEATNIRLKAKSFNDRSVQSGIASWLCAAAAFVTLAFGIFHNIARL